jgi:adenosylmethionine-8-amino-7-oxononanoate aminotransferase
MRDHAPNSWESRADEFSLYGFTDLPTIHDRGAVIIERGEGPYIIDVHGRRYLDGNSGLWNLIAGFGHKGLIDAAKAQYDKFYGYHAFFGRMSDQTVMLSEKMVEVSPFARGKVFYTNSGSEANDTMVKILWFLGHHEGKPQRRKILTRINAYHGVTAVSASMTGKPYNSVFGLPLPGFIHLTCPHYWRFGKPGETEEQFTQRLAAELEATIIKEGPDTIAGFFAEPVMGAGGVVVPSKGYFQAIRPVLKRYGIPLISDEVICGFGRTGNTWGCETFGFMPDAIIASKAMSAGLFPMGAIILGPDLSDRVMAASEAVEEFPHGFTGSGHPVGCAISLKAIDVVMNEGLADNVKVLAPKMEAGLRALMAKHKNIGEVRGVGLMWALEAVQDRDTKAPFPGHLSVSERIANACTDQGLICRPLGQAIVLAPPFILTDAQLDELLTKLDAALTKVFAEVG